MVIFGKNYGSIPIRPSRDMGEKPQSSQSPKPDKSIFGGKSYISKKELVRKFKKASPYIPGAGGAMYTRQQRADFAKEITDEFGAYFEPKKFEDKKLFRKLKKEMFEAKTSKERLEISRRIRFFEREIWGKGK